MNTNITVAITQEAVRQAEQQALQRIENASMNNDEAALMQAASDFLSLPSIVKLILDACRFQLKDSRNSWQGSMADVEDLAQEVKIRFYPRLRMLRSYNSNAVRAYIRKSVPNVFLDGIRKYKREEESEVPLEEDLDVEVNSSQRFEQELNEAMKSLNRTDKEIIERKIVEGQSLDEIADDLGMSRSNVHNRLNRALKKMRKRLSPNKA